MMKEDEESPPPAEAEVPEASPEENNAEAKPAPASSVSSRRNLYLLLAGIALVLAAVLCIALPLTLLDRDDDDSSDNASRNRSEMIYVGADDQRQQAFEAKLPLFGQSIVEGYKDPQEMQDALAVAFEREASAYIAQNLQNYNNFQQQTGGPAREEDIMDGDAMAMPDMAESSMVADEASSGGATDGVTDFDTNIQEENVDEADIIKADANFIYAAQGDKIVVWDTAGNLLTQTKMPAIELPESWGQQEPEEEELAEFVDPDPSEASSSTAKSMIAPDYMWTPTPRIQSMLLTDNHLVALVAGYHDYYYGWGRPEPALVDRPVLSGYRSSQVRLYEKTGDGGLVFVGSKDVNGNFIDARSIGDVVHLATASSVDTYTHLWSQLDRYQFSKNMTDEEYTAEAMALASDKLIPKMSRKLAEELSLDDSGELPTMMQINQWMTTVDDGTDADGNRFTIPFDQYSVASNVAQVTSFDVTAPLLEEDQLDTSASAYMSPSWFDKLYGTEDHLVLATSGWDWNPAERESTQKTYVVALKINGASTDFLSVGTLDGHLLNSYALDIVGGELRAATTVERNQWWWGGPVMMFEDDIVDAAVSIRPAQVTEMSGATEVDGEFTMEIDPEGLCPAVDDDCMDEENYDECLSLVREGCVAINTMESCPLQFSCQLFEVAADEVSIPIEPFPEPEPIPEPEESRTENYMSVLNLVTESKGLMTLKGRVQIGEKNERITSVRFFDNVAYAVTFERTDPFYVMDMSVPEVIGELKIPGFSSYLHSMNADNTMLLAIGQNATEDGRETGLMVTVFDATDPANPIQLQNHVFETSDSAYSSSNVQWDYKAFRYVAGKLIIPMNIYYYQQWNQETQQLDPLPEGAENFNGFAVLDVNENEITEQFRVSHMREKGSCSCNAAYLPTRSFVYDGDLMTVQDSLVVSTDLDTGAEVWRLPITFEGEEDPNNCCWYN